MAHPEKGYDVIIIGGGPAGLSAAIYAARDKLAALLIEKGMVGGQIVNTDIVENYPGFPDGISGFDLTQSMYRQAQRFGLEILNAEVTGLQDGQMKVVMTSAGDLFARAVIIAGGSERQKLGIPGEAEFTGKGVSYCATCDAAFFRDKTVAVVGGGNAALTEAIHLSKFASRIIIIHRRDQFRAMPVLQDKVKAIPRIEVLWDSAVEEIMGEALVSRIRVRHIPSGRVSVLDVAGVFVAIGLRPNTDYLKGFLALDTNGAIVTDAKLEASVSGIFAAGDIRSNSIRQVISAAGDGATAALSAGKYIEG
jgi:thioredoxin reductase (NADPH)